MLMMCLNRKMIQKTMSSTPKEGWQVPEQWPLFSWAVHGRASYGVLRDDPPPKDQPQLVLDPRHAERDNYMDVTQ